MNLRKRFVLAGWALILILGIMPITLVADPPPILSFEVNDMVADLRIGNWGFDMDNAGLPLPFPGNVDNKWWTPGSPVAWGYYAESLLHPDLNTTVTCNSVTDALGIAPENLHLVTMTLGDYHLAAYQKINTVNPAVTWSTIEAWQMLGQAGDERVYITEAGTIYFDGNPVLVLDQATFVIRTPYPTQAQIRAYFPTWMGNIGTGAYQSGWGYGTIDPDASHPDWAALFADANYHVKFQLTFDSLNEPVAAFTLMDYQFDIYPGDYVQVPDYIPINPGEEHDFGPVQVIAEVNSGTAGGTGEDMNHLFLNRIRDPQTGLIAGFPFTSDSYWRFGSTYDLYSVNLRFSLEYADFAKAATDWRLFFRRGAWDTWTEWPDQTLVSGKAFTIIANNVTQAGEFVIASPFDESTLPVELTSFNAIAASANAAVLTWTTASETNLLGYHILAGTANNLESAMTLTSSPIEAQNSSQGATYSYNANMEQTGTYYFWLQTLEFDGSSEFFGPVIVTLQDSPETPEFPERNLLGNAYPNPFNSATKIDVEIKAGELANLAIYNLAGQLVKSIPLNPGVQTVSWNGLDSRGQNCANGIYFYKLSSSSSQQVKKLILMK